MIHPLFRATAMVGCIALLSGCLLARQSTPLTVLAPEIAVVPAPDWPTVRWSLQIERPRADMMRDSTRLLVRLPASRLEMFPGAAWHEPVPDLIQSALLRAFEDSRRIAAVGRSGEQRGRFRLYSEVRRFEAVESAGLTVEIELQARLVLGRDGRVFDSGTFSRRVPASSPDLPALTAAYERALNELLAELVGWTLQTVERSRADREQRRDGDN